MKASVHKAEDLIINALKRMRAEMGEASPQMSREFSIKYLLPYGIKEGWVEPWPSQYESPFDMPEEDRIKYHLHLNEAIARRYESMSTEKFIEEELAVADLWTQYRTALVCGGK